MQIASAADLPMKAPAVVPMTSTWTGFYAGAHFGYGWGTEDSTATTTNSNFNSGFVFPTDDPTGVLGGFQGGYNYQFGQWVVGIEGDYSFSGVSGDITTPSQKIAGNLTASNSQITWLADITGRVGYAWSNWLLYAKGGAVWTHVEANSNTTGPSPSTTSGNETRSGWLIGGGVEWAVMEHVSLKLEYNYMDFGTADVVRITAGSGFQNHRDESLTANVVKIGANYRF
jgi:outer membrane immunogenic protein